jgi:hypothetical protein
MDIIYLFIIVTLQKFLQHITVKFTPFIILLYPSPPNPRIVSVGLIFPFSYMNM